MSLGRLRLKCDGTCAETRFCLSAQRTNPFKSAGASVQSTAGSRGVRINGSNGSNAGYTKFRDSVNCIGYPLHSPMVFKFVSWYSIRLVVSKSVSWCLNPSRGI